VRSKLPRVLTREQAHNYGLSRRAIEHRLERGSWRRVLPRIYLTVDTFTERDRQDAALLYAGPRGALSGASALRASGMEKVAQPASLLVLVPIDCALRGTQWVHIRRSARPLNVLNWTGPRRVELPRAVADHALTLKRLGDVRALVARAVSRFGCSVAELITELDAGPRRGSAHLRTALAETGRSASGPEALAARILRRAGLTGFEQNAAIRLPDGSRYYADFLWPELRAILEIDSIEYHFDPDDWSGTWDRHLDLTSAGYAVVHRPPSALKNPAKFTRDIRAFLASRS
jgi:hypothetical protein